MTNPQYDPNTLAQMKEIEQNNTLAELKKNIHELTNRVERGEEEIRNLKNMVTREFQESAMALDNLAKALETMGGDKEEHTPGEKNWFQKIFK